MNDNLPDEKEYKKYNYKLTPFKLCVLQNFPFIEADFDAITNYQLLCKVVEYLNHVIDNQNTVEDNFKIMADNLNTLYNYIDTLDLQDEVNNKLDEMAESGELTEIISLYLNTKAIFAFNNVNELKQANNLVNGSIVRTLGYYSVNDGGGATYKITDEESEDEYQEKLDNGLYANKIITNANNRIKFKDTTGTMQAGNKRNIAAKVGMKWARMSFVWESCETEKGVIDQTALQGYVNNFLLYKQLGVNTLALLCYNNTNYVDNVYDAIETSENLEGFVNFCRAVANKLKGNNVVYLIWNEPNGDFWRSDKKAYYYVNMIKEVSKAIKEVDSTALIAGPEQGGISYYPTSQSVSSITFFENCCKEGLLDYIDYISYHAYYYEKSERIIDSKYSSNIFLTKAIASKYSVRNIPIIITEFGGSNYTGGISEEEQARGIVKSYIINNAYDVKISSQYSFLNTGSDINEREQNFGMAYLDGTLKKSGKAVKFLLSLIGDYYFNRIEKTDYYDDYCFVYDNGEVNSKEIYCLWTTNEEHIITLKNNLVNCKLYDMYGNESITESTLLITNNPQYIEVSNPSKNHYITKEEVEKIITTVVQENNFKNDSMNNDSEIGVNNILNNSDFSSGKKYITDWVGTSQIIDDVSVNDKVLEITSKGQGSFFNNAYKCNIGDVLTWSCWIKTDKNCNISIGCEDGEIWSISNYTTERTGVLRYYVNANEWKKLTKTFIVSKNNSHNFFLFTQDATSENPIKLLLYHPQIVKASKIKNDFSPKLLDYEFGDFTPKLTDPNSSNEVNYTKREGHYYKIGNIVYFNLTMSIADNNSLIGTCLVDGLPYASKYRTGVTLGGLTKISINPHTQVIAHTYPNSKTINIKKMDNTGNGTDITFGDILNNSYICLSGVYYID